MVVPIPPDHVWQPGVPPTTSRDKVPVIAVGQIGFDPAAEPDNSVEQPDGVRLYLLQFTGSLQDWLAQAASAASDSNPIDPNTVTEATIAGQPAVAYQYAVTGVSLSELYAVKVHVDRLLLIEISNVDDTAYQDVLSQLQIAPP